MSRRTNLRLTGALCSLLIAWSACVGASDGTVPVLLPVDPVSSSEWTRDMARFAAEDAAHPPPARPVVFTGSSSVRLWTTLAEDLPHLQVLNRGFGGSQIRDAVHFADEVALRYRPARIVIYSGDNDTMSGRSPDQVLSDYRQFVARIHRDLPGTRIDIISIKPSPITAHLLDVQREANQRVQAWAGTTPQVGFIDVFTPMLDADGQPREDLFVADGLHLNRTGYALWRQVIGDALR